MLSAVSLPWKPVTFATKSDCAPYAKSSIEIWSEAFHIDHVSSIGVLEPSNQVYPGFGSTVAE